MKPNREYLTTYYMYVLTLSFFCSAFDNFTSHNSMAFFFLLKKKKLEEEIIRYSQRIWLKVTILWIAGDGEACRHCPIFTFWNT